MGTMFFTSRSESGLWEMVAHKMATKHIISRKCNAIALGKGERRYYYKGTS